MHRVQRQLRLALAVEFPQAGDRLGHIANGLLNGLQVIASTIAQTRLLFEQRFGIERDWRDGIVDVVRNSACHLAERAQALLLHHRLLCLAQVLVSGLQRAVELHLVGCERHVFAQLLQEFALAAAEALRLAPRGDEYAEDFALHRQRCGHQRVQSDTRQPLWKRKSDRSGVGLVNQRPAHAAG